MLMNLLMFYNQKNNPLPPIIVIQVASVGYQRLIRIMTIPRANNNLSLLAGSVLESSNNNRKRIISLRMRMMV